MKSMKLGYKSADDSWPDQLCVLWSSNRQGQYSTIVVRSGLSFASHSGALRNCFWVFQIVVATVLLSVGSTVLVFDVSCCLFYCKCREVQYPLLRLHLQCSRGRTEFSRPSPVDGGTKDFFVTAALQDHTIGATGHSTARLTICLMGSKCGPQFMIKFSSNFTKGPVSLPQVSCRA